MAVARGGGLVNMSELGWANVLIWQCGNMLMGCAVMVDSWWVIGGKR